MKCFWSVPLLFQCVVGDGGGGGLRLFGYLTREGSGCLCLCSQFDGLDLVVDLEVERVEVADERVFGEWLRRRLIVIEAALELSVDFLPLNVQFDALGGLLLDPELLLLLWLHLEGIFKRIRVNLLQDCLQGNE